MIRFQEIIKTYPGGLAPAISGFSHAVEEGSTTCFVGPSGCGKTTLLRMVNRMIEPDSGAVFVRGEDIADVDPVALRRSIGYVMQHSGLMPHRTVLANVADIAVLAGVRKAEAKQRAADLLELVNLDSSLFSRYPAELSGGQAQRVGVARGMVNRPDILIMDEPFAAVDPVVRRSLQREVLALKDKLATTILMVTHDIDEAFLLGDEVVILGDQARIEQSGTPEHIVAHPANEIVRDFIGAESWNLHSVTRGDETLVVDATGKVRGVLR